VETSDAPDPETMTMATETNTNGTTTRATRRGFAGLACLECGEKDTVQVALQDMHFVCGSCGESFQASAVRAMLASWTRVLDWVETAPKL
jgi:hypothetical protein